MTGKPTHYLPLNSLGLIGCYTTGTLLIYDSSDIITIFRVSMIVADGVAIFIGNHDSAIRSAYTRVPQRNVGIYHSPGDSPLSHWGRDKMDAVSQTMFSNAFSWIEMYESRLKFHWSLFLRFQLTVFPHWFRYWLGAVPATSHYSVFQLHVQFSVRKHYFLMIGAHLWLTSYWLAPGYHIQWTIGIIVPALPKLKWTMELCQFVRPAPTSSLVRRANQCSIWAER